MEPPIITERIYISGPMTGLTREQQRERFMLAEAMLRHNGYRKIVNPVRTWVNRFPWLYRIVGYRLTLLYDLFQLTRCHRIYKMPGWKKSRGAQIESCVAYHFGQYTLTKPLRDIIDAAIQEVIDRQEKEQAEQEPPHRINMTPAG